MAALFLLCSMQPGFSQEKTRKAVFIIVDGIPADVIEKLATPNLQDIARQGGYARAYVGGGKGSYTYSWNTSPAKTTATATANQAFMPVDAGTYTVQVRVAGTEDGVLTVPNVPLQNGKIYTVFARGIVGNTTSPLGASLIVHN